MWLSASQVSQGFVSLATRGGGGTERFGEVKNT